MICRLIKKLSIDFTSALFVLLISGFINLQPLQIHQFAQAQEPNICSPVTLTGNKTATDPILSPAGQGRAAGISDAGQLHTNFGANNANAQYKACLESQPRARAGSPIALQLGGWMWDTNFGYVSLGCDNRRNNNNAAPDCGAQNYGAYALIPADVDAPTKIRGYIYSENIGWISMGCDNGVNAGAPCPANYLGNYGVSVAGANSADASCPGLQSGDVFGFAWSPAVGWINTCGIHAAFPLLAPEAAPPVNDAVADELNVTVRYSDSVNNVATPNQLRTPAQPSANSIYANGNDYHEIIIAVRDQNGILIGGPGDALYNVVIPSLRPSISFDATTNTVIANQIAGPCVGCDPQIDAPTPVSFEDFVWTPGRGYVSKVRSIAPTNAQNVASFNGIDVEVRKRADNQLVPLAVADAVQGQSFSFLPPVEVTAVRSSAVQGEQDSLRAVVNHSEDVKVTAAQHTAVNMPAANQINIITQGYSCSDNFEILFDDNGNGTITLEDGVTPEDFAVIDPRYPEKVGLCRNEQHYLDFATQPLSSFVDANSAHVFVYAKTVQNADAGQLETNAVALQSIVEYSLNGFTVRYYSKAVTDSSLINQSTTVQGNVQIDILDTTGSPNGDRISQSIGERAQSKREAYYRVITETLRDAAPRPLAAGFATINNATLNNGQTSSVYYYKVPAAPGGRDEPCGVILNDVGDITFAGQKTIVVQGCNVYINKNITAPQGRLGIIALEDEGVNGENRGGNVYIYQDVTDVEAHFVLDGSIFSYTAGPANLDMVSGLPNYPNDYQRQLRNQLAIVGSIISNNTYGGCTQAQPLNGDGSIARTAEEKKNSCKYDFNYMRFGYAHQVAINNRERHMCWDNDVATSKRFYPANQVPGLPNDNTAVCRANNADANGGKSITTIIYREPSKLLPLFNGVR
ncbi:hypothetical protein KBD59_02090 [Candidatus Gracilibacteria bacterium]|nr:hypothetical protein [Candidatus Gracilibacteria bacterium]